MLQQSKTCEICGSNKTHKNNKGILRWYGARIGHVYCANCYERIIRQQNKPTKSCVCGCGQSVLATKRGGKISNYILGHNMFKENNSNWKGGKVTDYKGYKLILNHDHPFANNMGYVREHRLIYEEYYKCCLLPITVIHHKNGIKTDNRIENLEAMYSSNHTKLHRSIR